ncbi:lipoprotein [Paenibacillus sp. 1A_MP2]|uniref:lipoprotein n=1 Tax=Paenibacillus sp. 1A_MP2 TaxID=3457495 RepID=UPI003FCCF68B
MKKILFMLFLVVVLSACSNGEDSANSSNAQEPGNTDASKIEELQNENNSLKEQLENSKGATDETDLVNSLRETLNLTFKIISAMETKDYAYIESVSSSDVEVSHQNNSILLKNAESPSEVAFLNEISLEELEFRGYNQKDKDHFMLALAKVITTKGSEGNIELNFDFVRADNDGWLFNGFTTN